MRLKVFGGEHFEFLPTLQTNDFIFLYRLFRIDCWIALLRLDFNAGGFGILKRFKGLESVVKCRLYFLGAHLFAADLRLDDFGGHFNE